MLRQQAGKRAGKATGRFQLLAPFLYIYKSNTSHYVIEIFKIILDRIFLKDIKSWLHDNKGNVYILYILTEKWFGRVFLGTYKVFMINSYHIIINVY